MSNLEHINNENEIEYMKERLTKQIDWYDKKSIRYKRLYHTFQIIKIIIAALITLLSVLSEIKYISFIIALCGALVIVLESINQLYKYHEKWIQYRTTCEQLRYHKYLYETNSYIYSANETFFNKFVKNVEQIISSENNQWKESYNIKTKGDE